MPAGPFPCPRNIRSKGDRYLPTPTAYLQTAEKRVYPVMIKRVENHKGEVIYENEEKESEQYCGPN